MAQAFKYCPLCATSLVVKLFEGNEKNACPACDFVQWDNPLPVVAIIVPHVSGGVVLIKRGMPPRLGFWALPAGFVDHGEGPFQAAVREAKEECGLDIKPARLYGVYTPQGSNQILMVYLAKPVTQLPVPGSDALEAQVFPFDQLPADIAFPLHEEALHKWIKNCRRSQKRGRSTRRGKVARSGKTAAKRR
ncbi:MAG TPA: NUDIX hydrolase [Candidatus Obscuribacter sp.]|nr:NUDIX hydrolase [Candidatus Obscuribacter sp.]HNN62171.1 NUDIX hydrolase [Candidatus Obscuribacter sp.]